PETSFAEKSFSKSVAVFIFLPFVLQYHANAFVQKTQFTHPVGKSRIIVLSCNKNAKIRRKGDDSAAVGCLANLFGGVKRNTFTELLPGDFTVAVYLSNEKLRKSIHTAYTYSVQTARN